MPRRASVGAASNAPRRCSRGRRFSQRVTRLRGGLAFCPILAIHSKPSTPVYDGRVQEPSDGSQRPASTDAPADEDRFLCFRRYTLSRILGRA